MVSLPRLWRGGRAVPGLRPDVRQELQARFNLDEGLLQLLRSVERPGKFAGRQAFYVRVYRADRAEALGVRVRSYDDLSLRPELVLFEGHVEKEGIYLARRLQPAADSTFEQRAV